LNRADHINEYNRINRKYETKYYGKVYNAIKGKVTALIADIKEKGLQPALSSLSTDLVNSDLSEAVKGMYLEVGLRYARKEYRKQQQILRSRKPKKNANIQKSISVPIETKGFGFNEQWIAFILNYLTEFLTSKITFTVNETTRQALYDVLSEGIANGTGIDEIVSQLEHLPFTKMQAARITRTEINRAANVGTMAAVDTSEYEMNKEWISANDYRVRGRMPKDHADHIHLNGVVIDFNEKFKDKRNGDLLEFPGDPKASAASSVNCRCSIAPLFKEDDMGNIIPKAQPSVYAPVFSLLIPGIAASPNIGFRVSN
jgi:uncharacterized protein with gpF-like domain